MLPLKDENRTRSKPYVTYALIIVNFIVFLHELSLGRRVNEFFLSYGVIPWEITHLKTIYGTFPFYLKPLTAMFIHGGWGHILGNMLYLWIFGDNVEDALGHLQYLFFYIITGYAAVLAQVIIHPASHIPNIGASGAISGILGAYFYLYPHARVLTLVPDFLFFGFFYRLVYIPAFFVIGFWFVYQIILGLLTLPSHGGGIAFFAHVGGFITGYLIVKWYFHSLTGMRRYRSW